MQVKNCWRIRPVKVGICIHLTGKNARVSMTPSWVPLTKFWICSQFRVILWSELQLNYSLLQKIQWKFLFFYFDLFFIALESAKEDVMIYLTIKQWFGSQTALESTSTIFCSTIKGNGKLAWFSIFLHWQSTLQ